MIGQSYRRFTLAYLMILVAAAAGGLALIRWHLHLKSGATGSAQVAPATAAAPSSTVSVKDFGAKGDGVTDDAPAIQAAVDSLPTSGGTVFVPAGDYRLGDSIVIGHDNITLTGQGASSVLRLVDGVVESGIILPAHYSSTVTLDPTLIVHHVTISNLVLDGNHNPNVYYDVPGHPPDYFGVFVRQGSDVTLSGLIVRNWSSDGIEVGNSGGAPVDRCTIENCLISGVGRSGIAIGFATNTVVKDNDITDTPSQWWRPAAGCAIDVEVEGWNAAQTYPGFAGAFPHPYVDGLTIEDNILERQNSNTAGAAIALQPGYGPVSNVTITGNLISNHQNGVQAGTTPSFGTIPGLDHVTIANNWVDTPTLAATGRGFDFGYATHDLTITNNVVHDQAGNLANGVYLSDVTGATVSGNTFMRDRNAGYTNIAVLGSSTNITLSKNTWQDSLDPAIAPGIPYPYLQVDPTVTNLTDDGGIPVDPANVDKTPPTVSLGIASGTVISSPTPITVNASDTGSGIARVYFFVDGVPEGFSDTGPYVFTFDPSLYTAGPHELEALAIDRFANPSTASRVSVQVV